MPLLEVRDLIKDFGGLRAVDGCSFSVESGSITSLIGPNGAGKTTVFNIISGTIKPTSGRVLLGDADLTGQAPHAITRHGVGRTFQIARELGDMTVVENMVVAAPARGLLSVLRRDILARERSRAMELLDFVGIAHLADEQAKNLSYGQKKLLEFAAVLMPAPRLVLLDEPSGGVNPALLEHISARIEDLNRSGVTFLIVEHNMELVMRLSHTVVVMAHGDVLTHGPPDAVQVDDAVLDAYLGVA
ncbi:MAG: ATP-binding cassette domain-containing protein [Streptosporangiales bacterium]|nr:ATP-binding cassette domain-containing protein [Streptosporangiales bacterium]